MCLRLCSDGGGRQSMLKCRMKRGVTGLRPPPGGAQAAQIVMSYRDQLFKIINGGMYASLKAFSYEDDRNCCYELRLQ